MSNILWWFGIWTKFNQDSSILLVSLTLTNKTKKKFHHMVLFNLWIFFIFFIFYLFVFFIFFFFRFFFFLFIFFFFFFFFFFLFFSFTSSPPRGLSGLWSSTCLQGFHVSEQRLFYQKSDQTKWRQKMNSRLFKIRDWYMPTGKQTQQVMKGKRCILNCALWGA